MNEGPCIIGSSSDCAVSDDATMVDPYHYYLHTALEEGGCVTGSAYVPTGIGWPPEYKFLFIDFIFDTIYNLIDNPAGECRECMPPVSGFLNETFYERDVMVDMFFGPYKDTQALYIISRGTDQAIRRIRYTNSTNGAPVANITVSDDTVNTNVAITFDGSGSSDGAGEEITFLWDFGNGDTSTAPVVEYAYADFGLYIVKLTITDALGQTNQAQITVTVGIPPTANMISPIDGDRFSVGQEILVLGEATDRLGVVLNDTQIAWEVRQHHSEHFHPFLDRQAGVGNGFKLDPAPSPEDFSASTNSFLRIIMYATDSFGLVTTIVRDVQPKKVFLWVNSTPSGLKVLVDEYPVITPMMITSWENHKLRLNVLDQNNLTFSSWSTGGERKSNYTVPARNETNPTIMVTLTNNPVAIPVTAPVATPVVPSPVTAPVAAPVVPSPVTASPVRAAPRAAPVTVTDPPMVTNAPIVAPAPVPTNSTELRGTSAAAAIGRVVRICSIAAAMLAFASNFL